MCVAGQYIMVFRALPVHQCIGKIHSTSVKMRVTLVTGKVILPTVAVGISKHIIDLVDALPRYSIMAALRCLDMHVEDRVFIYVLLTLSLFSNGNGLFVHVFFRCHVCVKVSSLAVDFFTEFI